MRVPTRKRSRLAALVYSMAVLSGCVAQNRPEMGFSSSSALALITEEDIVKSHATTALEAVERLKPMYLESKVDLAPTAEREVFLNGVRLGGVNELRWIPAREVKEIRFVRAIDGGAYGVGRSGGAILVISKGGK